MPQGWHETRESDRIIQSVEERFWHKVNKSHSLSCWTWLGTINEHGYGIFWVGGQYKRAHRFAYELLIGPLLSGQTVDHLCRNRRCINPAHLEAVTRKENILRGQGLSAQNARKTHCKHGHEFTLGNTKSQRDGRRCRQCAIRRSREHRARQREDMLATKGMEQLS